MKNEMEIFDELIRDGLSSQVHLESILITYADMVAASNPDFIETYYHKIDKVFAKWEDNDELAKGLRNISKAITNFYITKFNETLEPVNKAISIFTILKQQDLLGLSYMIKGANYRSLGEIDEAVKYLFKGIKNIDSEGSLALYKCYCFYQLAEINVGIKDNESARKNYLKAAEMAEKINNNTALFRAYNGLGNLYIVEENYPEALNYLNKTLTLNNVSDSQRSRTYCDLGAYYAKTNDLEQSKKYYNQSVTVRKKANLMDAASTALIGLGETLLALDLVEESIEKLNEALLICKKFNSSQKLLNCYHLLALVYKKTERWKEAVQAYHQYDIIQQELSSKQLQKIYKLKNQEIELQKELVEKAHKEITDSINYAERIQRSFLATKELLEENLNQYFVFFLPKEAVSGDFYWAGTLANGNFAMVNADSTGHGVPGAIMSILNISSIEKAVEKGITNPSEIFNETRKTIIERLINDGSKEGGKDGMDASIISLDHKNNKFNYAAAQNPIWIIRNNVLIEIKGEKMPIGKHDSDNIPFIGGEFETQKGDMIYTLTDGFQDQFGGPKGKKFKIKPFKNLLLEIAHLPMHEQKEKLHQTFKSWKGSLEQIDDVCVIGVRI